MSSFKVLIFLVAALIASPAFSEGPLTPASDLIERWGKPEYNGARFPALEVEGMGAGELANAVIPVGLAGNEICLTVNAARDWYTATQTFTVTEDWAGGVTGTSLDTDYKSAPRNVFDLPVTDTFIRFARGNCDGLGADLYLLLSSWKEQPVGDTVSLFVLALKDETLAIELVDKDAEFPCAQDADRSGRYTHRCDFDKSLLQEGENTLNLYIFESRVVLGKLTQMPPTIETVTILAGPHVAR